ncbi:hypothetical protein [Metasolibacillus sp.]|uniref:hypothetical protein n=1 Tax=Metasolibacillus sp. TaxID=2703680 RepID=UPI0025E93A2A|nr:hypothetical protein [Metasolibacillus sp.]MCT6922549.1 hypothetical protein [Metasolibacillus sp.]MCT6939112.1 hypothetical protein [Metasolibacillus sp.]
MKRLFIICFTLLFFVIGCEEEENAIFTLKEVLNSFEQQGLIVEETRQKDHSIFGEKLYKKQPNLYLLNQKPLYIYIYNSSANRIKAINEFRKKTEAVNLVSFNIYEKDNILIFYFHEQDLEEDLGVDKLIKEALNNL